jgi:hypothetical protein
MNRMAKVTKQVDTQITLEMLLALPRDPESGKPETDALPSGVRFPLRELAPNASEYLASAQTP